MKTTFTVQFKIPQFNSIGRKGLKCDIGDTYEQTFKNAIKKLNKSLSENWISIEIEIGGQTIELSKDLLIETNFDFNNSISIF